MKAYVFVLSVFLMPIFGAKFSESGEAQFRQLARELVEAHRSCSENSKSIDVAEEAAHGVRELYSHSAPSGDVMRFRNAKSQFQDFLKQCRLERSDIIDATPGDRQIYVRWQDGYYTAGMSAEDVYNALTSDYRPE